MFNILYIYFMIDPGGPMIHHMADIAITDSLVQRCDFGAPDVPVSRQRL